MSKWPKPMTRIVLDTDVASLSYKGRLPMPLATRLIGHQACVTFITVGELPAGRRSAAGAVMPGRS